MRRILLIAIATFLAGGCGGSSTAPEPSPAPAACNYTLSITSQSVAAAGGSGSSTLTKTSGTCGWTASSDSSWLTVQTGSGGDTATLNYSIAANATTDSRTGRITVSWTGGSATITVTQASTTPPPPPPPPQACTYTLNPAGVTFPAAGGTGQSTLTVTGDNCSWTARSNQFWITLNAGFSGTSSGTLAFTVAPNTGDLRYGRIIVTHTVGTTDLGFTQQPVPTSALVTVAPNPCDVKPNPNPPNTDVTKNVNRLECTFDGSGSLAATGIALYEFWLGSPTDPKSVLLSSSGGPSITNPAVGCGYTGGGDGAVDVYLTVTPNPGSPNSSAPVTSAPFPLALKKNGSC